ncbi:tape measure domain-containing protein [Variovorax sp. SG517]|uniref:tape measure protein n=1 Tax=Variovorax sp. SG517 TaxID=2587117 RepID=UPI00159E744D|nr:tape measure protein [Variovorax sp. SG517]NVM90837.1 tape measure domain-containing protein [Variovorax sp. SG517]
MATNKRDVELGIKVTTDGSQGVKDLQAQVRDLAKAGGEAAPQFERLADDMEAAAAASARAAESIKKATGAERDTARSKQAAADAIKLLNIETSKAAKGTEEYETKLRAAKLQEFEATKAHRAATEARKAATAEVRRAADAEKELAAQARAAVKATKDASDSVGGLGKMAGETANALRPLVSAIAAAFGAQQFAQTIAEQQQLALSFQAVFGNAERAAHEMEFVRTTANKLGIESQVLARSYTSLAAATKGTAIEGEATRAVFEATARAMSSLGKSSAQTDQALTAISQMASKGTVSMEELRGQLGEALPNAMQAAAKGAGMTVEELTNMVEAGQVLAKDLLPALTLGLNELYANAVPPQTIYSEWARLKNVMADTANAIGEGGASKGIAKGLAWAALGVRGLSNAADVAGTAIGEFAAAVRTGNFDLQQAAALNAKYDRELRQAAEAAGLVAKAQDGATQATQAQVRAVDNDIAAQERRTTSNLAVRASYGELIKGAAQYTDLMTKSAAARQAEAATITSLVNIYGTEAERRQATAEAAGMQARASKDLADARNAEAIIAQSYSLRLQEEALQRRDTTRATQDQIKAAQQLADAKRAEADQAIAAARSKQVEVAAAQTAAEAYKDNAARVYELRGAAAEAAREVERLVEAQKKGKASSDDVAAAQTRAAGAIALYRDALRDATDAAQRKVQAEQRAGQVTQSAISVDIERANAMREVAQANGDATAATQAQMQATALQARAADEAAASARREAQAIREAADARENELRATGQLTAEKQAEVEATRRSADLKDLEAQKADILADKIRSLANSEQARTAALEASISAQEKALDLAERQLALENRRKGVDKNGFSLDKAGNTINAGGATRTSVLEYLKGAGVTNDEQARRITNEFADSRGDIPFLNNPGQKKYGGDGSTLSMALLKAAESVTFGAGNRQQPNASAPVRQETRDSRHVVDLKFPDGGSEQFGMASEDDAARFTKTLTNLAKRTKR